MPRDFEYIWKLEFLHASGAALLLWYSLCITERVWVRNIEKYEPPKRSKSRVMIMSWKLEYIHIIYIQHTHSMRYHFKSTVEKETNNACVHACVSCLRNECGHSFVRCHFTRSTTQRLCHCAVCLCIERSSNLKRAQSNLNAMGLFPL